MQVQHDSFINDVIDLCWMLCNNPGIVPSNFFLQRTTAFELFLWYLHLKFIVLGKQKKNSASSTTKIIALWPHLLDS